LNAALSELESGTEDGVQFAAVFQSPPELFQVCARADNEKTAKTKIRKSNTLFIGDPHIDSPYKNQGIFQEISPERVFKAF